MAAKRVCRSSVKTYAWGTRHSVLVELDPACLRKVCRANDCSVPSNSAEEVTLQTQLSPAFLPTRPRDDVPS